MTTTTCPRCWGSTNSPACQLCGGTGTVPDFALSEHFRYSELVITSHQTFPNDPSVGALANLRLLASELLERVRARVGPLRVTSGYRSLELDQHVAPGFLGTSAHSIGAAADVVPMAFGQTLQGVLEAVRDCGVPWDQAILEGGCCHIGHVAPTSARQQRRHLLVRVVAPAWSSWSAGGREGREPPRFAYELYTGDLNQVRRAV